LGASWSEWFYYDAVAEGGRLDVPSERQVVIFIQFHREDGPPGVCSTDDLVVNEFGCSAPFGLYSPPNKVGFCHPVTFDETEGGVRGLCVKLVDPDDCARMWLVGPDIPPHRVLYGGKGTVGKAEMCVRRQTR